MGLRLNKEVAYRIAEGLASGLKGTDAYLLARPHVSRQSAAALAPLAKRDPEVRKHLERLTERAEAAGILGRRQIQELLSLAAITPKNAESLSLPENAWLIESDTGAGVRGISSLDALRELSRIGGHYASPSPVGSTPARSLADCPDYVEMLADELALAGAIAGRVTVETAPIGQREEIDSEIWDTSWMDEMECPEGVGLK